MVSELAYSWSRPQSDQINVDMYIIQMGTLRKIELINNALKLRCNKIASITLILH